MAGSVNKVMLVGNLGQDPELRATQSGRQVATLSVATSEAFNDRNGARQERTEWHRVVCWGKLAELAERYLAKGRKIYVEGKLQTRSWEDPKSGQKRYSTEIVARELVFLDAGDRRGGAYSPSRDGGSPWRGPEPAPPPAPVRGLQRHQGPASEPSAPPTGYDLPADDDMPF